MPSRQAEIASLIKALEGACRKPLYTEIVLFERLQELVLRPQSEESAEIETTSVSSSTIGRRRVHQDERTWQELLMRATALLPYMTERDYNDIVRLASIMFLGYLAPYSTGNELALLQNIDRGLGAIEAFDPVHYVLNMPLEERLERSMKVCLSHEYSEMNALTDMSTDLAYDSFLVEGLFPLLQTRPLPRESPDILHLFAMAIHPNTNEDMIPHTSRYLSILSAPSWQKTKQLMASLAPFHFQMNHRKRIQLIEFVRNRLRLPEQRNLEGGVIGPLLHGAIPHLRASLKAFAQGAQSNADRFLVQGALISIACQTQNRLIIEEDWEFLLHATVEDHSNYHCLVCNLEVSREQEPSTCPHAVRSELMSEFIGRCLKSIDDVDVPIFNRMATSLTDMIEWQVDSWTKDQDNDGMETDGANLKHSPCLLAGLVSAATSVTQLFPASKVMVDDSCSTLLECGIQLLRHPDYMVQCAASRLVTSALSKRSAEGTCLPLLLKSVNVLIEDGTNDKMLDNVVAAGAKFSSAFAASLLSDVLDLAKKTSREQGKYDRFVAIILANCPAAIGAKSEELSLLMRQNTVGGNLQLAAAALSTRRSRFFAKEESKLESNAYHIIQSATNDWQKYQLARHALLSGTFAIASQIYSQLVNNSVSEKSYLWTTTLNLVSEAETLLSKNATRGIPAASVKFHSAVQILQCMQTICGFEESFEFQVRFLILRLDFLDLTIILRHLAREMRLTNSGPRKYSRSFVHLQSTARGFNVLKTRYFNLLRSHGAFFRHESSYGSLQVLANISRFVSKAAVKCFADVLPESFAQETILSNVEESSEPIAVFARRLDEAILSPMDAPVEPIVRATALQEILDSLLVVPIPYPKDFFLPKRKKVATLSLIPHPDFMGDTNSIECYPSLCFSFTCTGHFPASMTKAYKPCWCVELYFRLSYTGPLDLEEAEERQQEDEIALPGRFEIEHRMPNLSSFSPVSTALSLDGGYFVTVECPPLLDEGLFEVHVKPVCKDVGGREWEIPLSVESVCSIPIRITRSK